MPHVRSNAVINWIWILRYLFPLPVKKMSTLMKKRSMTKYKNATLANKVAKLQRSVARSKPEVKQAIYTVATGDGTNALYPACITLTQGSGSTNRIAEEIKLLKIIVRNTSSIPSSPAVLELFTVKAGMPVLTPALDTIPTGELDRTKYTVLARTCVNTSQTPAYGTGASAYRQVMKKFNFPMVVRFNDATAAATTNQIYCRIINITSGAGAGTTNVQGLAVSLFFTDS